MLPFRLSAAVFTAEPVSGVTTAFPFTMLKSSGPASATIAVPSLNTPPFASLGSESVSIFESETPGISLIIPITPLIIPINLFTTPSIVDKQLLIADLKASPTAEPIATPTFTKQPLIFSHKSEKKEVTLANAFFMFVHALSNCVLNHAGTDARAVFISVHLAPNHEPIAANTFVTLVYAFVNIVKNHVATAARAVFMSFHLAANHEPIAANTFVTFV